MHVVGPDSLATLRGLPATRAPEQGIISATRIAMSPVFPYRRAVRRRGFATVAGVSRATVAYG